MMGAPIYIEVDHSGIVAEGKMITTGKCLKMHPMDYCRFMGHQLGYETPQLWEVFRMHLHNRIDQIFAKP